MNILGVIPARYNSSRFQGKPLCLINGISMIERVYKRALSVSLLSDLVVATDDERIYNHVINFQGKAIMTSVDHQSGTDRCYEALNKFEKINKTEYDILINIQGDEPFIEPSDIEILAKSFANKKNQITTLCKQITHFDDLKSPNVVKVVSGKDNKAIYFSRQPIPFIAQTEEKNWLKNATFFKHIGIYAYRTDVLRQISHLKMSDLEINEKLEQLRWLENGISMAVFETNSTSHAVDTQNDVLIIEELIKKGLLK